MEARGIGKTQRATPMVKLEQAPFRVKDEPVDYEDDCAQAWSMLEGELANTQVTMTTSGNVPDSFDALTSDDVPETFREMEWAGVKIECDENEDLELHADNISRHGGGLDTTNCKDESEEFSSCNVSMATEATHQGKVEGDVQETFRVMEWAGVKIESGENEDLERDNITRHEGGLDVTSCKKECEEACNVTLVMKAHHQGKVEGQDISTVQAVPASLGWFNVREVYTCGVCRKSFESRVLLYNHAKTHRVDTDDKEQYETSSNSKLMTAKKETHQQRVLSQDVTSLVKGCKVREFYMCGICKDLFESRALLHAHVKTHTGDSEAKKMCEASQNCNLAMGSNEIQQQRNFQPVDSETKRKCKPFRDCKVTHETEETTRLGVPMQGTSSNKNQSGETFQEISGLRFSEISATEGKALACHSHQGQKLCKQSNSGQLPQSTVHVCSEVVPSQNNSTKSASVPGHTSSMIGQCIAVVPEVNEGSRADTEPECAVDRKCLKWHKCSVCEESFGKKMTLDRHVRSHTTDISSTCGFCQASFHSKITLYHHYYNGSLKKQFQFHCHVCKARNFPCRGLWNAHVDSHFHAGKSSVCDHGSEGFVDKTSLDQHAKFRKGVACSSETANASSDVPSPDCTEAKTSPEREVHLKKYLKNDLEPTGKATVKWKTPIMFKILPSKKSKIARKARAPSLRRMRPKETKQRAATKVDAEKVTCHICGAASEDEASLAQHQEGHRLARERGDLALQCIVCLKVFPSQRARDEHLREHLAAGHRFLCAHCAKLFPDAAGLKRHVETECKRRKTLHQCTECNKAFYSPVQLRYHMKLLHAVVD